MTEDEQRAAVVAEARSWLGTPYHHEARVKGAGVDCLTLIAEVFERAGVLPRIEIPHYPHDWHIHNSDERYMAGVLRYGHEVERAQPGDIVLYRFGRCYAHGAIVVSWPGEIIHSYLNEGVMMTRADAGHLGDRPFKFFSFWGAR